MSLAVLATAILLLWSLAIAVIDWRERRVPNALLLLLLVPAIVLLILQVDGLLAATWPASLLGLAAGFAVTLPGYWAGKLGAGDVKLAAVLGFVQGWPQVAWTLLAAALMLGAMSLAVVTHYGLANARLVRIPGAVALAGGFAVVLVAQQWGWL